MNPERSPTPEDEQDQPRSAISRQRRRQEQRAELKRIGEMAKVQLPEMERSGEIAKLPMKLSDDVFNPVLPSRGVQFCVGCGKHGKFHLRNHLRDHHQLAPGSDKYKMFEQTGRGFMERLKGASIDLGKIPREKNATYNAFVAQIEEAYIPLKNVDDGDGSQAVLAAQMRPSTSAETRPGPRIATSTLRRKQLYMERNDARYTGGETVHPLFKSAPDTNLMFEWQHDYTINPPYYLQRFNIIGCRAEKWMKQADEQLKFWRKVDRDQHPVLKAFHDQHLRRTTMIPSSSRSEPLVEESRRGMELYAQYVERYILAAMRSRRRYGQPISIDDALFSYEIASEFFALTKRIGVPVESRIGFAKALTKFFNFLNLFMESGRGAERSAALKCAMDTMSYYVEELNRELSDLRTFLPLTHSDPKEGTPYCVVRAILDHNRVDQKINSIMQEFAAGELIYINYNYVMSALMAYIVHSNAARNEVVYKMRYGSFYASTTATGEKVHGLREERVQIGEGRESRYWVGIYPNPKNTNRVQNPSSYTGGLFVLDETSHRWLAHYTKLRKFVSEGSEMEKPLSPFFLQWGNRKPIYKGSVCFYLRKFFADSKCGKFVISCNTTRHRAAEHLYSRYWREQLQALRYDADALSQLQGHDAETLLRRYNRDFVKSAVYAYVKLRHFADEDANNHVSLLALIQEKVLVEDLASINEERAADEATHRIDLGADEEAHSNDEGAGEGTEGARSSEGRQDDGRELRTGSGPSSPGQEAGADASAAALDDQPGPSRIEQQVGRAERNIVDVDDGEEAGREAGQAATGAELLQARYGQDDQHEPSEIAQEVGRAERNNEGRDQGEEGVEADEPGQSEEVAVLHSLTTPAKEEEILRYMLEFNTMPYEEPVKSLTSSFDLERFNRLRTAQPFQIFPWLEIREIPEINGKGVFAKRKIEKNNIVSDYRSVIVPQQFVRDLQSSDQFTQEERDLINDYVVDIAARCDKKHNVEPLVKHMSFLGHRALYKGSLTLGRLFNHSAKHPNMKLAQYCELFATPQGPQPLIFAYLFAVREIKAGEQLLWNYGPTYTRMNLECICSKPKCKPNLGSSSVLHMEVNPMYIRHIDGVPRDEDSLSQRIWTLGEGDSSPVTSGNVFRSLNNRTEVIGLVADAAHGAFEDPLEAYCRGRTLLLSEERDLDAIVGQDLSRKTSDLARLLHIARYDAYEKSNPVVLVLKRQEGRSARRQKSGIVILFGPLIGPLDPKRYGNCIVVEPQGNRFITATEQTVENKDERTLLEEYGCSLLYHFPGQVDEPMWRKLQNCDTTEQVVKALDSRSEEKSESRKKGSRAKSSKTAR